MILSVVIVNYNVKYFLEQCLASVFESYSLREGAPLPTNHAQRDDLEVWVVDNNSVDGSVAMVRQKFPQVHLIANADNPGFAKANNQALKQATGKYLLLLNPDTLVERDTFRKCVDFMDQHPDAGGLGVKMINGEGRFLKESKRGFPTPETSFYKISGLIKLFPHNKKIAAYYMGHLSDDETNEIDILPGAFLLVSREAFNKVGTLDESYFMYGEDIDFSWRIRLAGFKNYYLPSARIIHYKGESTKKGTMNYVYTFYNAMVIFARRYFSGNNARLYILLINLAIWARASFAFVKRILNNIAVPLADFIVAFGGFLAIKQLWATYWADNINYYPSFYTWAVIPIYILILMLSTWLYGGYEKPMHLGRIAKGMGMGAFLLLVFYSLLDETQRYSRTVLVLGSLWTLASTLGLRGLFSALNVKGYGLHALKRRSVLLVGSLNETRRVQQLMVGLGIETAFVGQVAPSASQMSNTTLPNATDPNNYRPESPLTSNESDTFVGSLEQLSELIAYYHIDEVIFCSRDLQPQEIISQMSSLKTTGVDYKIVPSESDFIIGSNAISSSEDLYTIDLNTIATPLNQRNKRLFDIITSLLLITLSPLLFWFQRRKQHYFTHCFAVLVGKRSWVGYSESDNKRLAHNPTLEPLPHIRRGIFTPKDMMPGNTLLDGARLNLRYARTYKVVTDLYILWKNLFNI